MYYAILVFKTCKISTSFRQQPEFEQNRIVIAVSKIRIYILCRRLHIIRYQESVHHRSEIHSLRIRDVRAPAGRQGDS